MDDMKQRSLSLEGAGDGCYKSYAGLLAHTLVVRQEQAGLWLSNPQVDHFLYYSLIHGEGASFILTSPTLEMQTPVPLPGLQFALRLPCSMPRLSSICQPRNQ